MEIRITFFRENASQMNSYSAIEHFMTSGITGARNAERW